jgi:copper(I)-binding protein
MNHRLFAAAALLMLASCGGESRQEGITVTDASVRLPAVSGRPGVAYFTIRAGSAATIEGVSSPLIERVELHDSRMDGNVMRMGPLQDRSIPAGGELRFEQGGRHAMLFGIDPTLKAGDRLPMTFNFGQATAVTVEAEVTGPAGHMAH